MTPAQRSEYQVVTESNTGSSGLKPEPGADDVHLKAAVLSHDEIQNNLSGNSECTRSNNNALDLQPPAAEQDDQKPRTIQLQSLFKDADPKMLESIVEASILIKR